jgi:phenylacetate-CoA ligase
VFALVRVAMLVNRTLLGSEELYKLRFVRGFEALRWTLGAWKAWRVYELARRRVPAYRAFAAGAPRAFAADFAALPEMDKHSYVHAFPLEAQCLGGEIPRTGVVVDESSGTSGKPNNWVRGADERRAVKKMLNVALHELLGREPLFVINAFALGPWATGMNVSSSVVDMAILKSAGPELEKIEATLRDFGPRYRYLITGYPPFLKTLVDRADVDWERYEIYAAFGGEGMSEAMRDYLGRAFRKVYGSYGASDLEINIAAENEFTIALRRELARDAKLRAALTWEDEQLPMVFQYSPLDYYLETNAEGELVVTLLRPTNVSPRVRYNIHDRGHVLRFPDLRRRLAELGRSTDELGGGSRTDLPLLFHYGRADQAVAFYGSKVTPADVEAAVFSIPELAGLVDSFALLVHEDENVDKRLTLALELAEGKLAPDDVESLRGVFLARLKDVNQDYREAARFIPPGGEPALEFHARGSGPFAANDVRLKKRYIQRG